MICKEDLVVWFKNLESYRRIDVMCTLLNLCLPFELRFLGTCLEELGRRDAQDLRGIELRVNNPQDFNTDVGSFQTGQPTDIKMRRKMALYLALMRACNRTGVNELYKTLDRWGDRDFTKFSDGDPLQELLLVYTMATNHPVFSFEQRLKCGEIYSKILVCKAHLNPSQSSTTISPPITSPLSSSTFSSVHQQGSPPPQVVGPFQTTAFQQQQQQQPMINPQQQIPNTILMPMGFSQATMTQIIQSADPITSLPMSVENMPSHIAVQATMMPIGDFNNPHPWTLRYPPTMFPILPIEAQQFPPQASSPHISQPSSPAHSRTGSPTVSATHQMMPPPVPLVTSQSQNQSAQRANRSMRSTRPTNESTPPPLNVNPSSSLTSLNQQQHQQSQQGGGTISFMGNDIMVQTIKNFDDLNMEGAITQLQSLNLRNGYNRPTHSIPPRQSGKQNWSTLQHQQIQWQMQQQQQQQQSHMGGMNYVHMVDPSSGTIIVQPQPKSTTGSESGSSTGGDMSPPPLNSSICGPGAQNSPAEAAGLHGNSNQTQKSSSGSLRTKQPINLSRLNGKHGGATTTSSSATQIHNNTNSNLDFNGATSTAQALVTSSSSGNLPMLIGTGQLQHFPPIYRSLPGNAPAAATNPATLQRQFPNQPNGNEMIFPFTTTPTAFNATVNSPQQQASPSVVVVPTVSAGNLQSNTAQTTPVIVPFPISKIVQSCFNCGSMNHTGLNCNEASMEDVTRNALYKLDYTMTNAQLALNQFQPSTSFLAVNNQEDPTIPIIDLTQDTSSSSSSSSTSSIHGTK